MPGPVLDPALAAYLAGPLDPNAVPDENTGPADPEPADQAPEFEEAEVDDSDADTALADPAVWEV